MKAEKSRRSLPSVHSSTSRFANELLVQTSSVSSLRVRRIEPRGAETIIGEQMDDLMIMRSDHSDHRVSSPSGAASSNNVPAFNSKSSSSLMMKDSESRFSPTQQQAINNHNSNQSHEPTPPSDNEGDRSSKQSTEDWLWALLREEELTQYYDKIRNDLQITRLSHFEYCTQFDLEKTGMASPTAKRLLAAAKKMKNSIRNRKIINKIVQPVRPLLQSTSGSFGFKHPGSTRLSSLVRQSSFGSSSSPAGADSHSSPLTCLIDSTDIKQGEKIGDGSFGYVLKGVWVCSISCHMFHQN